MHRPPAWLDCIIFACTIPTTPPARTPPYTNPAPYSSCTTWTSFCIVPCTTLALHHTAPHSPAPYSPCITPWTSFCTMPCSTLVLHHTAPPCTTLAYTTSACTTLDHTHAPHLPCTTSALHHTRLHHIRPALTGLTAEGDNKKQQREQAFLDAKCLEEINNKMVVEC
jgi:hypothetical protein